MDVVLEAFDAEEDAFIYATRVGVVNEVVVPPFVDGVEEEMVDDAVAEGGGENLADDWLVDDVGGATRGLVGSVEEILFEGGEILKSVKLEDVLVVGLAFTAFAGL